VEEVTALEERFAALVSGKFGALGPKVEEVKTLAATLTEHGAWVFFAFFWFGFWGGGYVLCSRVREDISQSWFVIGVHSSK
jgi:hypothetical protein